MSGGADGKSAPSAVVERRKGSTGTAGPWLMGGIGPWESCFTSAQGFTLVELLVVLIIIAVGSSMILVRVGGGFGADASRRFAVEFSQFVRKGRVQALWDGVPVAVCIDPESRRLYLSEGRGTLSIPGTIRIEADGLLRNAQDHVCTVLYPDGSSSGGMFKISKDRIVLVRLQLDTVTGTLVPYRANP